MNSYNDNEKGIDGFFDDDDVSEDTIDLFDIARAYGMSVPQEPSAGVTREEAGTVDFYQLAIDAGSFDPSGHQGVLYFGDDYDDDYEYGYSDSEEEEAAYPDGFEEYETEGDSGDFREAETEENAPDAVAPDEDAYEDAYEAEEDESAVDSDDDVFTDDGAQAFFSAHSAGFDENDYEAYAYPEDNGYRKEDEYGEDDGYDEDEDYDDDYDDGYANDYGNDYDEEEEDGVQYAAAFCGTIGSAYEKDAAYRDYEAFENAEDGYSEEDNGELFYYSGYAGSDGDDYEKDVEDLENAEGDDYQAYETEVSSGGESVLLVSADGDDMEADDGFAEEPVEALSSSEDDGEDAGGYVDINSFLIAPDGIYAAQNAESVYRGTDYRYDAPIVFHGATENEKHGAFYYWAKRKTAGGWVKFTVKCFAVLLLAGIVSGVLYFNGLLNLIDFKAASDFEQFYNLSDTDYKDDDEETVYSTPVYYNESTTIEGFNESMIDIPKKDVINILLIGTDVRGGTYNDRGNTDSMILVSLNTRDKNIRLTSFMRDMYVDIPGREWQRLNAAYAYGGPQLLFDTLKKNFDVDVDLYVRVNFANFRKIVNHVGGVDIELTEAEAKYMNKYSDRYKTDPVEPGWQHLDGAQALSYARCRKIDSDFNRTKRQRTVILALVKEIKGSSAGELNSLLNVFLPMIQTNMSKMQIISLMTDATRYLNSNIETLNVPIKNSWRSATIRKRSVICPNFELNKTAITAHIYSTYSLDVENTKYQNFNIPQ